MTAHPLAPARCTLARPLVVVLTLLLAAVIAVVICIPADRARASPPADAPGLTAPIAPGTPIAPAPLDAMREPPVPPGLSAAAPAIALLGPGVDYRLPAVAHQLARDGEGDLIAFDFSDNDIRPFATAGQGTAAVLELAGQAPAGSVVIVKELASDPRSFGSLMTFAVRTPARVIVWLDADPVRPDWPILIEAVRRFADRLFIVPLSVGPAAASQQSPSIGALDNAPNALTVAGIESGNPNQPAAPGAAHAAVTFADRPTPPINANVNVNAAAPPLASGVRAALVLAAAAARKLAAKPSTTAAGLKTLFTTRHAAVWTPERAARIAPSH